MEISNQPNGIKLELANLECLITSNDRFMMPRFDEENFIQTLRFEHPFLKSLPSLKFLFASESGFADRRKFEGEKQALLPDLKMFDSVDFWSERFDYQNWGRIVEHWGALSCWPGKFDVQFSKLLECKIPFDYFREAYLRIQRLTVGQVTDERALLEFLRNVPINDLHLDYDFNLGQSFLEEIANFVTFKIFL